MLNIDNLAHEEHTENTTAGGGDNAGADVAAQEDDRLFFYLSLGLGALSGLLLVVLVVLVLFHRLASLHLKINK